MKIKCLLCNDIIESKHRHNLISCKCNNCYIDGGQDYLHFGGEDFGKILILFDDGTEILASDKEKYKKKYGEWEKNRIKRFVNNESFNNYMYRLNNDKHHKIDDELREYLK